MWGSMTKWVTSLLRGCNRRRRPRVVRVFDDPENVHHESSSGMPRAHRRTYYYSMFSVRLAIMIMLAVLIALLTILTWHFTTVYTTRSIKNVAYGLRTELLNRPIARMWNLLNNTVEATLSQVQLAQFVVGQYTIPVDPASQVALHRTMRNVSWAIFAARKSAKSVTVAYRNGQLQAFDRASGGNSTSYYFTDPLNGTALGGSNDVFSPSPAPSSADPPVTMWPDWPRNSSNLTWYSEKVNKSTGVSIGPREPIPSFDLSKDIDNVLQMSGSEVSWRVTVNDNEASPLLSSAAPIRHVGSNEVVAVVGITTALSSISAFLRELTSSHSGYLYLTTASGQLLATSTSSSIINSFGPILANESSDPVIRAGAQWLNARYGFEGLVEKVVHAENVVLEGRRFYVDTFSLVLPRLQMVGVIIIPRSYVMGEVDRRGKATLAILIAISSCILLVGCVFIIFFTSGVSTEMKLRAELINHLDARRRAEASSNYKSQFLANMSHELRTPMAAVIGLLDILLCDDCLSSEQVNMVSQIRRCSTALLRLLNNILDISKVESGKLVLESADFDLNRELEGLVDMFSVQCVDHGIEIVLDLADDMPSVVSGDSARTTQIFANLIANSIKFTSSGHVILRGWCGSSNMSATALRNELLFGNTWDQSMPAHDSTTGANNSDSGQFLLWFEVEDTGCGIDVSKWEAVFDSFVQADPSTTRTYGGTGLGLCIVRSLVRKMGGDIKIVKKDGRGTLLRFYLMFGQPHDSELPDTPRVSLPAELDNAKVLLAMKGDTARGTLGQWMHLRGLNVYEASNWDETIQGLNYLLADEQRGSSDAKEILESDEVSLVLSAARNPGRWKMQQHSKLLAVLDSELLIPWSDDSTHVVSMLSVLDEFRDKGIMISWLFTHDTPNALKTQLRQRGYFITANQPLYKSKLLQLLSTMVGCLDRGSSRDSKYDNSRRNSGYYDDIKAAAVDRHELEKIQSQVQSKLNKSLPRVLEKWPSTETSLPTPGTNQSVGEKGAAVSMKRSPPEPEQGSIGLSTISRIVNEAVIENIHALNEKVDSSSAKAPTAKSKSETVAAVPPAPSHPAPAASEPRPSTRNVPAMKKPAANHRLGPSNALAGIRILLAEDTPILARLVTIMLEKMGARVVAVADGLQAVDTIARSRGDQGAIRSILRISSTSFSWTATCREWTDMTPSRPFGKQGLAPTNSGADSPRHVIR